MNGGAFMFELFLIIYNLHNAYGSTPLNTIFD